MYANLIGLMAIRKIAKNALAASLGINRGTLDNKLEGSSKFTIAEMFFIQQKYFPDVSEQELFKREEKA